MKLVLGLIMIIALASMWAFGVATLVSLVALVLKVCGLTMLSSMSYWLPVKLAGGWLVSLISAAVAGGLATVK